MTYPASPSGAGSSRVRPDSGQFWAGGVATAVVAALIALVGILICRWTLNIPILAPAGDGAWGDAHTGEYVLVAALVALVAAGLLYLLMLSTPQPALFFRWIIGLVTLIAVVYPFSSGAPLDQKVATAAVNLVLGVAIGSLLTATSARAIRRNGPRPSDPADPADPYGQRGYEQEPTRPTYNEPARPTSNEPSTRPTYTPRTRPDDGWQ
jgi:Family of unknown function (DUF6069)